MSIDQDIMSPCAPYDLDAFARRSEALGAHWKRETLHRWDTPNEDDTTQGARLGNRRRKLRGPPKVKSAPQVGLDSEDLGAFLPTHVRDSQTRHDGRPYPPDDVGKNPTNGLRDGLGGELHGNKTGPDSPVRAGDSWPLTDAGRCWSLFSASGLRDHEISVAFAAFKIFGLIPTRVAWAGLVWALAFPWVALLIGAGLAAALIPALGELVR